MAGTETKRIIELTEASNIQSGDYIAVDSNARGTKKVSTDTLATSAALTAETNARTGADNTLGEQVADLKSDINKSQSIVVGEVKATQKTVCDLKNEETTYSNNYKPLGTTLKADTKYLIILKLEGFSTHLSEIRGLDMYRSNSGAGFVETLSLSKIKDNENYVIIYTPSQDVTTYRLDLQSTFVGVADAYSNFAAINLQETTLLSKVEADKRIKSANRFNINTVTVLHNISTSTGELISQNDRNTSDYIDIAGIKTFTTNKRTWVQAFYDSSKTFISAEGTRNAGTYTPPSNAVYMRIVIETDYLNTFKLTFDDESTNELLYGYYSDEGIIAKNIEKEIAEIGYKNRLENTDNILDGCSLTSYSGAIYFDNSIFGDEKKSVAIETTASTPSSRNYITTQSAIDMYGVYAFRLLFFAKNASNISSITLYASNTQGSLSQVSLAITGYNEGWNDIIVPTFKASIIATWGNFQHFTIATTGTGAYKLNFASIIPLKSDKARVIVVDDHGYQNFLTLAYPRLKALGVPTTWGIQPGALGVEKSAEAGYTLTQAQIDTLADDPYSEFSFHSWAGTATADVSDASNRELMQKCITYLKKNGIMPLHSWRCAWVQNSATNYEGIKDMFEGGAMHDAQSGFAIFPFMDFYNIPRMQLHVRTQDWFDNLFDYLKKTHCVAVVYTHSIVDSSPSGLNMTTAELEMFIDGLDTGISEGWLEGTTFSWLMTRYYADKYKIQC